MSSIDDAKLKARHEHRASSFVVFVGTFALGFVALPIARAYPESMHAFFGKINPWYGHAAAFGICFVVATLAIRLFSPRWSHLGQSKMSWRARFDRLVMHPPAWSACALAVTTLAILDLIGIIPAISPPSPARDGFLSLIVPPPPAPQSFKASIWDWLRNGIGAAVAAVLVKRWLDGPTKTDQNPAIEMASDSAGKGSSPEVTILDRNIEKEASSRTGNEIDWTKLEPWLRTDSHGECDFLGHQALATRLKGKLVEGASSIGIVGPFGAGKSNIIHWIRRQAELDRSTDPVTLIFSEHSCWGFENSSSAIQAILKDAIKQVGKHVDVFHVASLPESYRQTFAAGGEWPDRVAKLILRTRDHLDQFQSLSNLLCSVSAKLVIVVEDLDRNESKNFDLQEVLAFLQTVNKLAGLAFILTGGIRPSQKIDYAKLCSRIELLASIDTQFVACLVSHLRSHCLLAEDFAAVLVKPVDESPWSQRNNSAANSSLSPGLVQAVSTLLRTPRSLRRTLQRTYSAWKNLYGDVNWDQLIAAEVLRHSAPEAFTFLMRNHAILGHPPEDEEDEDGLISINEIKANDVRRVREAWNAACSDAEWDADAALRLIHFVVPGSEAWFGTANDQARPPMQSAHQERYWRRIVNESVDLADVRDRDVIRDLNEWLEIPSPDSVQIRSYCNSEAYRRIWEPFGQRLLSNRKDRILPLLQHLLGAIQVAEGANSDGHSQGLSTIRNLAEHHLNWKSVGDRIWMRDRINDTVETSLMLAVGLAASWARKFKVEGKEDAGPEIFSWLKDGVLAQCKKYEDGLDRILSTKQFASLYELLIQGKESGDVDVSSWRWLGPYILSAVRRGSRAAAIGTANLPWKRMKRSENDGVTTDCTESWNLLALFSADEARSLIDEIEGMKEGLSGKPLSLVQQFVRESKVFLKSLPVP